MGADDFYRNRTAVITGGGGGFGKAFGVALAAAGAHVGTIKAELPPDTLARVKAKQFIALDGGEQHIVDAMMFLTSPRAEFITGETLRVTGGMAAGV